MAEGAQQLIKRPYTHFYIGYYSTVFCIKHDLHIATIKVIKGYAITLVL